MTQSKTKLRNKRWRVSITLTTGHSDVEEVYFIKVPSKRYALAYALYKLFREHSWLLRISPDEVRFTHLSTHANHIQQPQDSQ
jgi:hypothetical protein